MLTNAAIKSPMMNLFIKTWITYRRSLQTLCWRANLRRGLCRQPPVLWAGACDYHAVVQIRRMTNDTHIWREAWRWGRRRAISDWRRHASATRGPVCMPPCSLPAHTETYVTHLILKLLTTCALHDILFNTQHGLICLYYSLPVNLWLAYPTGWCRKLSKPLYQVT